MLNVIKASTVEEAELPRLFVGRPYFSSTPTYAGV